MATKDSFDAFVNIVRDKIDEFSENIDPPKIEIIQNELKEKFSNLAAVSYTHLRAHET